MQHEWVRRAQAGDHDAFASIVHEVLSRLYATAHLITRDAVEAEEAVQEALIAAWRDLRGLRDPDRLDAWLHRLLVRACYRVTRRERRHRVVEIPLLEGHDVPVHELHGRIADHDRLERALARLPLDQRTVLVLAYYADLSLADVASVLDVPVGTAKSRLHRASLAARAAIATEDRADALGREVSA